MTARNWNFSAAALLLLAAGVVVSSGLPGCSPGAGEDGGAVPPGVAKTGSPTLTRAAAKPPGNVSANAPATKHKIEGDRLSGSAEPAHLSAQAQSSPFRFTEIAAEAGIDFVQCSGMNADKHFPSANGSGVAVFDYDNDGKLDLYFATSTIIPVGSVTKGPNRLYRNLGNGKFEDVTAKAGVGFTGFCHGVVAGDIDNDGDQDLFLCNYGPNVLYLNNGNGTFTDISRKAGIHRPALVVFLQAGAQGEEVPATVTIDAVAGPSWKLDGKTATLVRQKVKKGTRLVVRQTDPDSPHGVAFRNSDQVQRLGEPEKPSALLREVGQGDSRVEKAVPPLGQGKEPVVIAEFEVIRDLAAGQPVAFSCSVFDRAWSSGGAFLDYDNDGDLDLYVSNYGEWEYPEDDTFCGDIDTKIRLYCSPRTVRTVKHFLFRNNGDGTFSEVYDQAILSLDPETGRHKPRADGHGFGVVTADLNGDGLIDIYVANDMNPNFLFLNKGDGTFEDATESSGAAYDEKGQAQSGMGADAEDVDGDGLPEIFVTNFANEYATLYQNLGKGTFMDSTPFFGLAADTMPWVKWGTALVDLDNDGWPDTFISNGHVDDNRRQLGQEVDYEEPALLFANIPLPGDKGRRFRLATRDAGAYFDAKHVGRGAAFGDLDNDGDIDIVVNHKDSRPAVLRNDTKNANHWVRLDLKGVKSNRDAVGARVEVVAGGRTIYRQRKGGFSMESSNDPRLLVGLGTVDEVSKLTVRWPSGAVSTMEHLKVDRPYAIVEPENQKTAAAVGVKEGQGGR